VVIVGAGTSGLCAGYELAKSGFDVVILEASARAGGRVITFRDPDFAPGLHGEGGAMRVPDGHFLTHAYVDRFRAIEESYLRKRRDPDAHAEIPIPRWEWLDFEMENKFVYLSGLGETLTIKEFNRRLEARDGKSSSKGSMTTRRRTSRRPMTVWSTSLTGTHCAHT